MSRQTLILRLDGVTAADYLAWFRDPEPPALGAGLRSIEVDADPVGDAITATLTWDFPAPPPHLAASVAGLPVTADVRDVRAAEPAPPVRLAAWAARSAHRHGHPLDRRVGVAAD